METSDEELEWRETVHQAKRADRAWRRRANRPLLQQFLVQLWRTSWQIALILLALIVLLTLLARALRPFIPII